MLSNGPCPLEEAPPWTQLKLAVRLFLHTKHRSRCVHRRSRRPASVAIALAAGLALIGIGMDRFKFDVQCSRPAMAAVEAMEPPAFKYAERQCRTGKCAQLRVSWACLETPPQNQCFRSHVPGLADKHRYPGTGLLAGPKAPAKAL